MLTTTNIINILIYMKALSNFDDLNTIEPSICSNFIGKNNNNIFIIYELNRESFITKCMYNDHGFDSNT